MMAERRPARVRRRWVLAGSTLCAAAGLAVLCLGIGGLEVQAASRGSSPRYCPGHDTFRVFWVGRVLGEQELKSASGDCRPRRSGPGGAPTEVAYLYGECNYAGPCIPPLELRSEPLGECHARHPNAHRRGVPARVELDGSYIQLYT